MDRSYVEKTKAEVEGLKRPVAGFSEPTLAALQHPALVAPYHRRVTILAHPPPRSKPGEPHNALAVVFFIEPATTDGLLTVSRAARGCATGWSLRPSAPTAPEASRASRR